jgi:hypothetical protein
MNDNRCLTTRAVYPGALALALIVSCGGTGFARTAAAQAPAQRPDYLSEQEADKIRDAQTPEQRIKLFISFADDRMKKLQYELSRTVHENRHDEMLNGLLNDYVGCVDDAADQIDVAQEKQSDIHEGLKLMKEKDTEFLAALQKIEQNHADVDAYRDNLEDAIQGTKDALESVDEASKTGASAPAPVRRKQQ